MKLTLHSKLTQKCIRATYKTWDEREVHEADKVQKTKAQSKI